jgi:hypothetical protein
MWVWQVPEGSAPEPSAPLDFWALVEIMGRQQIVGRITEQTIAGGAFLRVDVPAVNGQQPYTRFYGASSIYCISPVTEVVAKKLLEQSRFRNEPVGVYDLPMISDKVQANQEEDGSV